MLNLPYVTHLFADLADVQRIIVAVGIGLTVLVRRVFPSLPNKITNIYGEQLDALRERGGQVDDEGALWEAVKKYELTWGKAP